MTTPIERALKRTGNEGALFLMGSAAYPAPDIVADATEGHRLYRAGLAKRIERILLSHDDWDTVKRKIHFELGDL